MSDLREMARSVIDTNSYLALGTTEPDGTPRVSPVFFTHFAYRDFYWVSSPSAHHSLNVAARPPVAIVIYDSTAAIGAGRAVYLTATATEVPAESLPAECEKAYRVRKGGVAFTPEELRGDADLRLYVARAAKHEVHIRGGDPDYGTGIDTRREITL